MPERVSPIVSAIALAVAVAPAALAQAPPNDAFGAAVSLAGASGVTSGTNVAASKESGEPAHAGNPGSASVWYRWTAPTSGRFGFDTLGSDFDTLLAVYQGSSVDALRLVRANDDADPPGDEFWSRVVFDAVAGAAYAIAVDGYDAETGDFPLRWRAYPPPPPRYEARVRSIHPGAVPGGFTYYGDTVRASFRKANGQAGQTRGYKVCVKKNRRFACVRKTARGRAWSSWNVRMFGSWVGYVDGRYVRRVRFTWYVNGRRVRTATIGVYE